MINVIKKFLGEKASGLVARDRMQHVLLHDRLDITPDMMASLKKEVVGVMARYVELDGDSIAVNVERTQGHTTLVSNVAIRRVYSRQARGKA